MNFPFDPDQPLIIVQARVDGPRGIVFVRMALDTGATTTVVSPSRLAQAGYELPRQESPVTTASGTIEASQLPVKISALGIEGGTIKVLAFRLPPRLGLDGLLGLDFIGPRRILIDRKKFFIEIEA